MPSIIEPAAGASAITALSVQDADGVDVPLMDGHRRVGQVSGLHGLPQPRRIVRPRPGGHGHIDETRHYASRQIVFNGILLGADPDALWGEYDTILQALWGAVEEPRLLKWTRGDGVTLQSAVKLADAFDPVLRAADVGRLLAYQLILDREDPRNYGQTQATVTGDTLTDAAGGLTFDAPFSWTFAPSSGGEVVVTNAGTIPSPVTFRLYGYCTSPTILNTATGLEIALTGEISAGDYLEIDTQERTVTLGGVDRTNLVDFAVTDWRCGEADPGQTTFRLLAANFDTTARLDVLARPAYA